MRHDRTSIVVENLSFGYDTAEVLHGISFKVEPGNVTGLLGPNGAGKSTTLKILAGILQARAGRVAIDGLELPAASVAVKKRLGYVPESAELYDTLTAVEFLELCGRLHEIEEPVLQHRINALLESFGLSAQRRNRLGSYSKGMRQKVLLMAALLHDPTVIVLDEPLTGLDVESVMMTKDLLASLAASGKTILYSSHVLDVVERFCDRVIIIDRGSIVADASPDELKARAQEASLEAAFRNLTHAENAEPRVRQIIEALRS